MPLYTRRYLRQTLGRTHIRDTYVGTTTASWFSSAYSLNIVDVAVADLALSGQNAHVGAWIRAGSTDMRVASFHVREGVYFSLQGVFPLADQPPSGGAYERHAAVSPVDKDRALDEAVKRLRSRREVTIDTVDGLADYPLPDAVEQVLDVYAFASPTATLSRVKTPVRSFAVVGTETGPEVRVSLALGGSQQLVLDAVVRATLGSSDAATIDVPDERLVLLHAEAECWGLLAKDAPRGTADQYRQYRDDAARQYAALARNFKVPVDRPLRIT